MAAADSLDPPLQAQYSHHQAEQVLRQYPLLADGGRLPRRDDTLITRTPPQYEAPYAGTARMVADVMSALARLGDPLQRIVWDAYGGRPKGYNWHWLAERWTVAVARSDPDLRGPQSQGQLQRWSRDSVRKMAERGLAMMVDDLNGLSSWNMKG